MNKSVQLAIAFAGTHMVTAYELAQNFYDESKSKTYIDSVRRQCAKELEEGVKAGLLTRVKGKKYAGSTKFAHRYTCRKYADKIGLKNVPYRDGRNAPPRTGIIALIEKCVAEMIIDKTYRHKKFTSNEVGIATVIQYIREGKTPAARKILSSHANTYEKNVKYVVRNHRGVLDDKGLNLRDLVKA